MGGRLEGQIAIVTGASGGLGEHFARLLASEGAAVALTARRLDRVEAIAADLVREGRRAMALQLDVARAETIAPVFAAVEAALGPISILVNNAGVSGEGLSLDLSIEDFDATFDVNVRGVFFAAQAAARLMIASGVAGRGEGRIVNIGSIASSTNLPGLAAYCGSKAAVAMLTRVMAREWARAGIAVNALGPGYIVTDLNAEWFESEGGAAQVKRFPRRRLMKESDLDDAFLLLAGPAAAAMTGSLIILDDGQSLPGGG